MEVKHVLFLGLVGSLVNGIPLDINQANYGISPHIVGGSEAPEGYAVHMMALVFGEHVVNLMCGASIISDRHVLTAAHCIDALVIWGGGLSPTLRGVYGSNEWASTEKRAQFINYINHADYNSWTIKNDIGVLFLANKLTFSERVAPVALNLERVEDGDHSYVTGWGRLWNWGPIPARLQLIYVKTIGESVCLELIREVSGGLWVPPVDQSIEICTLHPKGEGFGMCNGDSGSALVSIETGMQTGIVSWGFPCARGAPDVFVRISGFKNWLRKVLRD